MRLRNRMASITLQAKGSFFSNLSTYDYTEMKQVERNKFEQDMESYIKDFMAKKGVPRSLINPDDVMELANDVYFTLGNNPYNPSKGSFLTHITNIVNSKWVNRIESDNADKRVVNKDTESITVSKDTEEGKVQIDNPKMESTPSFEGDALNNVFMEEVLSTLTDKEKEAFVLVRLQGYSLRDTAKKIGCNHQTTKNIVDRAVAKLQSIISRDDLR